MKREDIPQHRVIEEVFAWVRHFGGGGGGKGSRGANVFASECGSFECSEHRWKQRSGENLATEVPRSLHGVGAGGEAKAVTSTRPPQLPLPIRPPRPSMIPFDYESLFLMPNHRYRILD